MIILCIGGPNEGEYFEVEDKISEVMVIPQYPWLDMAKCLYDPEESPFGVKFVYKHVALPYFTTDGIQNTYHFYVPLDWDIDMILPRLFTNSIKSNKKRG